MRLIDADKIWFRPDARFGAVVSKFAIDSMPTIDTAPVVHGRWITWAEAGNDVPSEELYECSACHDAAPHLVNGFDFLSAYCPNCGAKMDEVMNDENK